MNNIDFRKFIVMALILIPLFLIILRALVPYRNVKRDYFVYLGDK